MALVRLWHRRSEQVRKHCVGQQMCHSSIRATDRPSSAGSNRFSVRWSSELPKNCVSHIDASHSRQPLVKGERLVRYEVNAVMASHETFGFSRQASKCAAYTHTHTHGGSFKKSAFSSTCTSSFQQARQPVAKCMELPKPPAAQSWVLRNSSNLAVEH